MGGAVVTTLHGLDSPNESTATSHEKGLQEATSLIGNSFPSSHKIFLEHHTLAEELVNLHAFQNDDQAPGHDFNSKLIKQQG